MRTDFANGGVQRKIKHLPNHNLPFHNKGKIKAGNFHQMAQGCAQHIRGSGLMAKLKTDKFYWTIIHQGLRVCLVPRCLLLARLLMAGKCGTSNYLKAMNGWWLTDGVTCKANSPQGIMRKGLVIHRERNEHISAK